MKVKNNDFESAIRGPLPRTSFSYVCVRKEGRGVAGAVFLKREDVLLLPFLHVIQVSVGADHSGKRWVVNDGIDLSLPDRRTGSSA